LHGTVGFFSEIAISLNFTAEHTENAKAQEKIIFDNRTQMNADNQDFKYKELTVNGVMVSGKGLALNRKLNVRHLII
jgi:hypothetical protein